MIDTDIVINEINHKKPIKSSFKYQIQYFQKPALFGETDN